MSREGGAWNATISSLMGSLFCGTFPTAMSPGIHEEKYSVNHIIQWLMVVYSYYSSHCKEGMLIEEDAKTNQCYNHVHNGDMLVWPFQCDVSFLQFIWYGISSQPGSRCLCPNVHLSCKLGWLIDIWMLDISIQNPIQMLSKSTCCTVIRFLLQMFSTNGSSYLGDTFGMGAAIAMLRNSLNSGKYDTNISKFSQCLLLCWSCFSCWTGLHGYGKRQPKDDGHQMSHVWCILFVVVL